MFSQTGSPTHHRQPQPQRPSPSTNKAPPLDEINTKLFESDESCNVIASPKKPLISLTDSSSNVIVRDKSTIGTQKGEANCVCVWKFDNRRKYYFMLSHKSDDLCWRRRWLLGEGEKENWRIKNPISRSFKTIQCSQTMNWSSGAISSMNGSRNVYGEGITTFRVISFYRWVFGKKDERAVEQMMRWETHIVIPFCDIFSFCSLMPASPDHDLFLLIISG